MNTEPVAGISLSEDGSIVDQISQPHFDLKNEWLNPAGKKSDVELELSGKAILTYLDTDGTLAIWKQSSYGRELDQEALECSCECLRKPEHIDNAGIMISTGRGLSGMQPLAHNFTDLPLHMIATTNGLALFINHDRLPTDEWLPSLDASQQHSGWAAELRTHHGFDQQFVMRTMQANLKAEGFVPAESYGYQAYDPHRSSYVRLDPVKYPVSDQVDLSTVDAQDILMASFFEDGNSLVFELGPDRRGIEDLEVSKDSELTLSEEHNAWIQEKLCDPIETECSQEELSLTKRYFPYRHTMLYDLNPKAGDGKRIVLDYILENITVNASDVIAAGDSRFDKDMLEWDFMVVLTEERARTVELSPIQVGEDPALKEMLQDCPRRVQVPSGDLSEGLSSQFDRIIRARGL